MYINIIWHSAVCDVTSCHVKLQTLSFSSFNFWIFACRQNVHPVIPFVWHITSCRVTSCHVTSCHLCDTCPCLTVSTTSLFALVNAPYFLYIYFLCPSTKRFPIPWQKSPTPCKYLCAFSDKPSISRLAPRLTDRHEGWLSSYLFLIISFFHSLHYHRIAVAYSILSYPFQSLTGMGGLAIYLLFFHTYHTVIIVPHFY